MIELILSLLRMVVMIDVTEGDVRGRAHFGGYKSLYHSVCIMESWSLYSSTVTGRKRECELGFFEGGSNE